MSKDSFATIRGSVVTSVLLVTALISAASVVSAGGGCPTSASEISTDRPDVTNSSRVVPYGSLQVENGVDWTGRERSDVISGSATRLRFGVARAPL